MTKEQFSRKVNINSDSIKEITVITGVSIIAGGSYVSSLSNSIDLSKFTEVILFVISNPTVNHTWNAYLAFVEPITQLEADSTQRITIPSSAKDRALTNANKTLTTNGYVAVTNGDTVAHTYDIRIFGRVV